MVGDAIADYSAPNTHRHRVSRATTHAPFSFLVGRRRRRRPELGAGDLDQLHRGMARLALSANAAARLVLDREPGRDQFETLAGHLDDCAEVAISLFALIRARQ
ncbi:MAG TPA: hypothetical protein VNL16_09535 [Chloroflexota bacterium]|nr:hypothetical protein [Chloroflexota bacterium]